MEKIRIGGPQHWSQDEYFIFCDGLKNQIAAFWKSSAGFTIFEYSLWNVPVVIGRFFSLKKSKKRSKSTGNTVGYLCNLPRQE